MVDLLKSKGFEDEDIKLLVDDDDDYDSPDHVNVKNALNWLCEDRSTDDIIFMHFSGHGTQIPADDDDVEIDNLDEAICLEELFLMADDDLKQFFAKLPEGIRATVVMDCCHSGSMLDGTEVAIEGAKDEDSEEQHGESESLLSILGGSRDVAESANRSLPISTICDVMSSKLGRSVEPTGAGINGAMANIFGGTAGKLMFKFALSQLNKQSGGGNPMVGALLSSLTKGGGGGGGGGSAASALLGMATGSGSSGSSNPLSSLLGGGGGGGSKKNAIGSLIGGFLGGGSKPSSNTSSSHSSDPMSMITGMLGDIGLEDSGTKSSAPSYNPTHQPLAPDVCVLITGCQSSETSADVRPPGGDAFGALTKTLTSIHEENPDINYYDLVSGVRKELSKGGFKQNPCLECADHTASEPFIC